MQEQYMYIYDVLSECITCGDTCIEATSASIANKIQALKNIEVNKSGYQYEFEVS